MAGGCAARWIQDDDNGGYSLYVKPITIRAGVQNLVLSLTVSPLDGGGYQVGGRISGTDFVRTWTWDGDLGDGNVGFASAAYWEEGKSVIHSFRATSR